LGWGSVPSFTIREALTILNTPEGKVQFKETIDRLLAIAESKEHDINDSAFKRFLQEIRNSWDAIRQKMYKIVVEYAEERRAIENGDTLTSSLVKKHFTYYPERVREVVFSDGALGKIFNHNDYIYLITDELFEAIQKSAKRSGERG